MFGQILASLSFAFERSHESAFGRDEFGMDSWPPHRLLADAIVASDAGAAVAAIAAILDAVESEVRRIIGAGAA
jgi:DNA-binding FadR family transcriptional regulator